MSLSSGSSQSRLLVILLLFILLLCPSVIGAEIQGESYTLDGVAIQMGEEWEADYQAQAESIFQGSGVEKPSNAVLYAEPLGDQYVLFSEREIKTSSISGSGRLLLESGSDSFGVIVADNVDTSTDGVDLTNAELQEYPETFKWELVEVTGGVRTISYTVDPGNQFVQHHATAVIGDSQSLSPLLSQTGRKGRWATLNLSGDDYGHSRSREIASKTSLTGKSTLGTKYEGIQWWVSSEATVTGVAMTPENGEFANLAVREVSPGATEIDSPAEASSYKGEVVTFTADGVGTRISSQETLLAAKKCAPSSVTNPATGCMPIPADAVIHTGVLFNKRPESESDAISYAGISNVKQSKPAIPEHGKYRVTGRVVNAQQIDPRMDGTAILVYDRKRLQDISVNTGDADRFVNRQEERIQEQITANESEWSSIKKQASSSQTEDTTATAIEENTQEDGQPNIEIVSSRIGVEHIERDQTSAISLKLQNNGGEGSKKLTVRAGEDVIHNREVEVPGGESKTVHIPFEPTDGNGTYDIFVNGDRIGAIQVGDPENGKDGGSLFSSVVEFAKKIIYATGFIGVGMSVIITFLRPIKEYRGGKSNLSDKQNYYIIYGCWLLAVLTSILAGHPGTALIFGLTLVLLAILHGLVAGTSRLYEAV